LFSQGNSQSLEFLTEDTHIDSGQTGDLLKCHVIRGGMATNRSGLANDIFVAHVGTFL